MDQRNYQKMLFDRIEMAFSEWQDRESIAESELYRFLHTLKRMSGTIGMDSLAKFCSSQLAMLSVDNMNRIPVHTLNNFKSRIHRIIENVDVLKDSDSLDMSINHLDDETTVLIIDDNLEFVSYIKELLEKMGAQVIIALNGKRGTEKFYSLRPNFVLIDLYLPDMTGFEVLDRIAETARARHVIVAIIGVEASRVNKITAYERGAMDFLTKPLDTEVFISYLFNRNEMRKIIGKSVVTDGLTGVGNRRYFDEKVNYFAELSTRSSDGFSLIMLDIDHFKKINDLYGHPAGDDVLRKLGEVMMEEKRETDHAFRYGGEEFAFLLPGATVEESVVFIDRVRTRFNAVVFQQGDYQFSVTFSVGIASYKDGVEKLISSADQALYEAKRSGRDRTVVYNIETPLMRRKLHLIIVDDDMLIRTMLFETLSEWSLPDIDITVHAFPDGPSFLESNWFCPEEYYIVLLDGIMPKMDGLEVLERLKREKDEKNVLVSMMTARTGDYDIKAALWLGADDYIMKPFQLKDILFRVQQLMTRIL
ncbi:diguanylate cyclase [Sporosarcina limicola]|uniref:Diguanylate cyclase (GGDEF)-like protein n=1 Tax=Sporosarcina limicola TaxID=34101 RepID=A0A927MK62_9BACL|nr:diguanylate cyclase (GGDEF)-like protein [Sporosarcina limicola]